MNCEKKQKNTYIYNTGDDIETLRSGIDKQPISRDEGDVSANTFPLIHVFQ